MLAVLLMRANTPVTADQLVDRVWGDHPPMTARGTLSSYLTRIRKAGIEVGRQSGAYLLAIDPDDVDAHLFTRLAGEARTAPDAQAAELFRRAFGLWRGEPLSGVDTPWARGVRESLLRRRFEAELDHADVLLRLGAHAELLTELPARAAEHPFDERLAGQLMTALHRAGRSSDALARYREFRTRLADELGTDPGQPLRELHQRILSGDRLTGSGVPRQLPARPGLFAGRTDELEALSARRSGTAVISAIGGGGGMGKTWLALQWAHDNSADFPDGQLYVNLRGFDPRTEPLPPTAALRGFLGALGVAADDLPAAADDQAALYRSRIAGRRMLVLLDNAAETAQVLPLLPGSPGCVTLVTSRRPLTGLVATHGALPVPLDVLSDDDAVALLVGHLGAARVAAEPGAVKELLSLCAGLPLALGIVAARAAVHPSRSLASMAVELRSHRLDGLDAGETDLNLRAVLSWSYRALPPDAITLVGLMALAPGDDIGQDALAALFPCPAGDLTAANLVTRSPDGRYRMHDLVRLYAAERAARELAEDVRTGALRRVVDHYLRTAHAADKLLDPGRPAVEIGPPVEGSRPVPLTDALGWFAVEHRAVLASQRLAAEQGWHAQAWQLAAVLDTYHHRWCDADTHIAALRTGLSSAQAVGDLAISVRALRNLGQVCARAGQADEAKRFLTHAVELAGELGDTISQAHANMSLAQAHGGDDLLAAHQVATAALGQYRAGTEPHWEASALNQLGWISALLGWYDEARAHCVAALELHRRHGIRMGEAETLDSLGYIAHRAGRLSEAVGHYRAAVALFDELGHNNHLALTLERLGEAHAEAGERSEAEEAWHEAARLHRAHGRTAEADRVEALLG
ncbi:AfsR/SARP family transcriptional regulator [Lentzea sp.]|uniref:AfsR/SARP family transcriptional regulator n=1 Tax=Lentzea sp. TaxID=56099 RepID=UPI002ED1A631